jgi:hypothetical protein
VEVPEYVSKTHRLVNQQSLSLEDNLGSFPNVLYYQPPVNLYREVGDELNPLFGEPIGKQ